jgi:uncharacterized protein YecT (DUF1311 family)
MKNKATKALLIGSLAAMCVVTSCGKEAAQNEVLNTKDVAEDTIAAGSENTESAAGNTETESTEQTVAEDSMFLELSNYGYVFMSGAGGWSMVFKIEKDGYFHGSYHDSEMGSYGEGYEDGTVYVSEFTGHFSEPVKVDEKDDYYAYEMTILDISYENEVGTEEIKNNIKYIYSEAYGLVGTEKFFIYPSGTPVDVFSDEVMWWLDHSVGDRSRIETPIIVNVDQEEGICSYVRSTVANEAIEIYADAEATYFWLAQELTEAETTADMLDFANRQYETVDDCLNDLWILVKYNTDETEYQKMLEEQRAWLKERDAAAPLSTEDGGTLAAVDYAQNMAEMTMDRCKVLTKYLDPDAYIEE